MQETFLKKLLSYLPSKLLPALIGFVVTPIVTRLFLPDEYGYWVLALVLADFLYALSCSGIGSGVYRFFAAYKVKSELNTFFATFGFAIATTVLPVSAISVLIIFLLKQHINPELYPLLFIGVVTFIVQAVFTILLDLMVAQGRSVVYTVFELLSRYLGIAMGLVLVLGFGFRIDGLMWGSILILAIGIPFLGSIATRGVKFSVRDIRLSDTIQIWRYGLPLAIGNMAMWGLRLSDRYLISFFRSESEVGLYSVAYNLSGKSVDILAALFGLSMFPMLIQVWETQGRSAAEDTLGMFTRLYLVFGMPLATGLMILASPFVTIFASEAYHDGYRVVGYVAFSSFFWQLSQIASYGLLIKKNTRQIAINQIIAALVNVGLNLLLLRRFGYVVAGATTLIGYIVLFALQAYSSRFYLTWRFPWRTLRNITIATILMSLAAIGVYSLSGDITGLHLVYLPLCIVAAILIYFVALWMLGEANVGEKEAIGRLGSRIRAIIKVNND